MPPSRNGSLGFHCFLLLVQGVLGDMNSWPSRILNLIFVDEYSALYTIDVVAFFCGNGVPLKDALFFYTLCNDHNPLLSTINFTMFYRLWETGQFACPYTYYDVRLKKTHHIGPYRRPGSSPPPDEHIPLGIDATGNGQGIRDKVAQVFGLHAVPGSDR